VKNELWKWRNGGKRGNPKGRISPLPTVPWKSRKQREIPTFPQLRRKQADGKVENQKQVSHFPTATNPLSPERKTGPRAGFALRPAAGASRLRVKEQLSLIGRIVDTGTADCVG
jgi:hypothetical protein